MRTLTTLFILIVGFYFLYLKEPTLSLICFATCIILSHIRYVADKIDGV